MNKHFSYLGAVSAFYCALMSCGEVSAFTAETSKVDAMSERYDLN